MPEVNGISFSWLELRIFEDGSSRCLLIMSIISSFIVFSSSALLLLCVDIVGRGKEEVADDDDDEAVSRRNVGEGSLCLDVAYRDCRRECVGERKIGDVDIAGILAECDDDDDDDDDDDESSEEDELEESDRTRCARAMSAVHDSIRIGFVFR